VKLAAARTSTALAVMATAGASAVFVGATPAYAASDACGNNDGVLVTAGICELSFTSGTSTFTPTADMTKLEVLLVGAGGNGAEYTGGSGYATAAAGGGGEVKIVDLTGATGPLTIVVATPGTLGSVTSTTSTTVQNGGSPADNSYTGGTSGSGQGGSSVSFDADLDTVNDGAFGAGGGAGGPAAGANGGAGVVVGNLAPAGSLFTGDTRCFGGGGAIGSARSSTQGLPGCGGGAATLTSVSTPTAHSGGGGGSVDSPQAAALRRGADGIVIVRWSASDVTLSFDVNGHGTAPAAQTVVAGATATPPADPSETGFVFEGWYADAALTTPADFTAPVTSATTLHAKWSIAQVAVSFDTSGRGTAPSAATVDYGTAPTRPTDPAETGFVFEGWYADAALTTPADFSAPVTSATTFYAEWSIAQVTVSFDMRGRGTAPAAITVDYGTAVAKPADPTATGFEFRGWYTDAALTTRANFADPVTASATLYAAWTVRAPDRLAATGLDASPLALAGGTLLTGLGLVLVAGRRRRSSS
jgi:uncharacterized repeat protein (TIGR02543 family)